MTDIAPIPPGEPWLALRTDLSARHPPSASERLIRALEAHAIAEAHDLADCDALVQRSADPVVRLLMGIIVEDEHRHHALLQSMVRRLQTEVDFVASPGALPVPTVEATSDAELADALRALIRDEHEGARHLRHIARQEAQVYTGLYSLLLEVIARDSEKHATILRFLLTRAEGRVR